ncbi:MAG: SAM-dependent methyltransferase [Campylobacterota bacterium]
MHGKLFLIGCGPGDADLLTCKALKTIQKLDVALIDHLLTQEIIDLIPERTKVVFVGKEKGKHSFPQSEINAMITEYAHQGYTVGRLKCGDPYIFGRGTEEAIYASQNGIETEVIPGISSALSGPMSAGIAPTARGVSTGVSVVSAHLSGDLITAAKGAPKPAILVFGNVVHLAQLLPSYRYESKEERYDIVTAS